MNELVGECQAWEDGIRPAKYCSVEQGNNCPNSKGSPRNKHISCHMDVECSARANVTIVNGECVVLEGLLVFSSDFQLYLKVYEAGDLQRMSPTRDPKSKWG